MTGGRFPKAHVRGADKQVRGPVTWETLDVELSLNAVTPWSFTAQDTARLDVMVEKGGGAIIDWDDNIRVSGRFEELGPRDKESSGENAGPGTRTLAGSDDMKIIANEVLFPSPGGVSFTAAATGAEYDVREGPAETVIKGYVAANCGTARPAWRNDGIPDLDLITVAPDQARGLTQKFSARMSESMPTLRLLAKYHAAGPPATGFVMTVVEDPGTGQLVFETTPQRDLTAEAVFAERMGNLTKVSWQEGAPTFTHAIVGGSGAGTARTFRLVKDTAAAAEWRQPVWGFVDQRDSTDATELEQAGQEPIDSGKGTGLLSATCVDTARLRFGRDFGLGDLVTVEVRPGLAFPGTVTTAKLHADSSGARTVELTILPFGMTGDQTNDNLVLLQKVADLEQRLARLLATQ